MQRWIRRLVKSRLIASDWERIGIVNGLCSSFGKESGAKVNQLLPGRESLDIMKYEPAKS